MKTEFRCRFFQPAPALACIVIGIIAIGAVSGCSDSAKKQPQGTKSTVQAEQTRIDAQDVLSEMRAVYRKASSYTDNSSVVFYAVSRVTGGEEEIPFTRSSIAFSRPNRLHLAHTKNIGSPQEEKYELASNGAIVRSFADELPDQIHEAIAPRELSTENFVPEPALRREILENSVENTVPQLALLLGSNDSEVFDGSANARMAKDRELDGKTYHRVEIPTPAGKRVLWIDKQQHTLRRMELPIENQRKQLNARNQFSELTVWVDFEDVTVNPELDDEMFTLAVPDSARRVRRFIPPPPAGPPEHMGKPAGQFAFTSLDGDDVTPESLAGKVVVLDFWSTVCPPCQAQTPVLNEVYERFRNEDEVSFLAVSTDSRVVPNETVENTLRKWGGEMTIVRDLKSSGYQDLNIRQTPSLLLLDRQGRLQSFQIGAHTSSEPIIDAVERLVGGENLVASDREKHAEFLVKYEEALDAAEIKDSIVEIEVIKPQVSERALPKQFQLKELWNTSSDQIGSPGDVKLLGHETKGPGVRLIALDGGKSLIELDYLTGKVLGRHKLPAHDEPSNGFIRSWTNGEGENFYLVSGVGWQKVYVLDGKWESTLTFPDEPHSGIGDVLFDDLTGSGTPVVHVGYWGGLGVQGGTLDGRRLWSNRRLDHVLQLGSGPSRTTKDKEGNPETSRTLWCTSTRGTLMQLGPDGKSIQERYVSGQALMYFASQAGNENFAGLAIGVGGQYTAVGFDQLGEVAWEYPLPKGDYVESLTRIQSVLMPDGSAAWLVAASDGSMHWLDESGELLDRFDYGQILTGLAMHSVGDQTLLFVSTASGLTAWNVDMAEPAPEPTQQAEEPSNSTPAAADDKTPASEPSSSESEQSTSSEPAESSNE